ncbi:MAG: Pseudogene of Ig-like domain repeat protein [Methanobrevibacter sp. CfCl-M3]
MMINKKLMFIVGFSLLSVLLLVSATTMNNDMGDSKNMTYDGLVFNFTATPHRLSTNNSIGYTEVNITTDRDVNKSFTLSNGNGESHIDLLNNHSVSLNTTCFNVPDNGLNKSYNLIDNNDSNVSLNIEFDKLFNPLGDVLPSPLGEVFVSTTIQAAVDQASNGDTVVIPYKAGGYTGAGNKNVNITNKNLIIVGVNSGGDVVIDGEGSGRIFNITGSSVNITGLKIQNTNSGSSGGAINYNSGSNGSVNNCTFTNTSSSSGAGGAVYMGSSGGSVNGSTFTNTSSSGGSVNGSTFTNTSSSGGGGAVYFSSSGSVNGSTFTNTSSGGGAVYFSSSGSVNGSTFTNTSSRNGGGAVYFNNGGGSVNGSTFTNTSSGNSLGGAVYFSSGGSVTGSTFTNTSSSGVGGAVYFYSGGVGSVNGSTFTNTSSSGVGGAVYMGRSGGSVNGSTFTNTSSSGSGGAVCLSGGGSVSGCSIVNCTAGSGGAGIYVGGTGNVSYNRFVNNTVNGVLRNVNGFSGDRDFNWWGTNNISDAGIGGSLPNNHYTIELSAGDTSTKDVNKTVNSPIPVPLGYKMVLNTTNDTGDISNLPDFNATIKLNNNTGLFRFLPFMMPKPFMSPGDSVNILAKDPWNDTINNPGNYIFSALVDNQQLNINLAATMNTSLNLTAANIIYGDNTSIIANLTDSNGLVLSNKPISFSINGTNYTATTDGDGVAVLNISGLHAGSYNVTVSFDGDVDYNPSTNNTTFNVGKRDTSLSISKTVNSTNPVVGDLVGYTIKVMNNGTNNISTLILVNDTLSSSLEFVGSSASVGDYSHSSGLWTILGLNSGDTATLNITVRVKSSGNLVNRAFLVLDDYNNSLTNDSSVDIIVKPNGSGGNGTDGSGSDNGGSGGNGTDGSGSDNGGSGGFDGLAKTGIPLIFLLLLCVFGLGIIRRK